MNNTQRRALQDAYVTWLCPSEDSYAIAFTLNYKAGITKTSAIAAAKQFWQRVDCAVHPARQVKQGTRVPRVCILEGEHGVRNWHYHTAVDLPADWEPVAFMEMLINTWGCLHEAGGFSDVQELYWAKGWINYICKDIRRSTDGLCLDTSHLRRQ